MHSQLAHHLQIEDLDAEPPRVLATASSGRSPCAELAVLSRLRQPSRWIPRRVSSEGPASAGNGPYDHDSVGVCATDLERGPKWQDASRPQFRVR